MIKKRLAIAVPILLSIILFILNALDWKTPKVIPIDSFSSVTETAGTAIDPNFITFQLKELIVINKEETAGTREVQIYVTFEDDKSAWGYSYPFGNDVFLLEGGGIIPLGKNAGSVDVNSIKNQLQIRIVAVDSELGTEQVTNDILSLMGNVLTSGLETSKIWGIVISLASERSSEALAAYLEDANPIDEQTILLTRDDNWGIGQQRTITSENEGFSMTYEIYSSAESIIVNIPVVVTSTPIFYVPTSTPLVNSPTSLTLFDENTGQNNLDGAPVVLIPAGEFTMGLTGEQIDHLSSLCDRCSTNVFQFSQPVHLVYLDDYWMYKTEVTVAQYKQCMLAEVCNAPHDLSSATITDYFSNPKDQEAPVINVDWDMANAYCAWAGGRLPTEAEWEKAARGNDGRLFPWGDRLPNYNLANVNPYFFDVTYVGKFPDGASPYGVLDMAGNVYEWVSDWYHDRFYETGLAILDNPIGPPNSEGQYYSKVVRGGSFSHEGVIASSGLHDWFEKQKYGHAVGFRCVVPAYP